MCKYIAKRILWAAVCIIGATLIIALLMVLAQSKIDPIHIPLAGELLISLQPG